MFNYKIIANSAIFFQKKYRNSLKGKIINVF